MPNFNWSLDISCSSERDIENLRTAYLLITGYPVVLEGGFIKGHARSLSDIEGIIGVEYTKGKLTPEELEEELNTINQRLVELGKEEASYEGIEERNELEHELNLIKERLKALSDTP